jgi:hypothetical protein
VDGVVYFCVECLWVATKYVASDKVPTYKIATKWEDVEWDGDRAVDVVSTMKQPHWNRIMDADLTYPILVNEEMQVLDGCHRLVKYHLADIKNATIKVVSEAILAECIFKIV